MSKTKYFEEVGDLKASVSYIHRIHNEFIEKCSKVDYKEYNFLHNEDDNLALIDKLDKYIEELKTIKDSLKTLREKTDNRTPSLFKTGDIKKKIDAILTQDSVVTLSRNLKMCRTALDKLVNRKDAQPWIDYLQTKSEPIENHAPKAPFSKM